MSSNIIGSYKEFVVLERERLNELKEKAADYLLLGDADTSNYHKGMAIIECIEFIKQHNIYNDKNFKIHR